MSLQEHERTLCNSVFLFLLQRGEVKKDRGWDSGQYPVSDGPAQTQLDGTHLIQKLNNLSNYSTEMCTLTRKDCQNGKI